MHSTNMKDLLQRISRKAILLEELTFTPHQIKSDWLGNIPSTNTQILELEERLGLPLPQDYKTFLSITNGFSAPCDIEPSFVNIANIDYLKNIDKNIVEAYNSVELERSILVAGINEEQYFLLIPPVSSSGNWDYWKFANWIPGEESFENLYSYFSTVLEFLNTIDDNQE